mmetsp:Transcript_28833/g.95872  ORF Transcript_28833/g.95872 Transcript_28833/m.95872 type:complete len:245 (-) Transcript_28833:1135-1869(-)
MANMSSPPPPLFAAETRACRGWSLFALCSAGDTETAGGAKGMSPNQTMTAVLSSLPSRRCASSTSNLAACFAGSLTSSRSAAATMRTESESETGPHTPSLAKTKKVSLCKSRTVSVTSGTALTTLAGCLYSKSPKPRDTDKPAYPSPRLLACTMRQMPFAFTTEAPSCSMRRRSPATSGVWSSERRTAVPSFLPMTTRLSPALATANRSLPSSSGPKKTADTAVDPAVAQAEAAPPSSLFKYWK